MLIIEVTNPREVMRQRIGRLGERLIGRVVDPEAQVEKALIQELEAAFKFMVSQPSLILYGWKGRLKLNRCTPDFFVKDEAAARHLADVLCQGI